MFVHASGRLNFCACYPGRNFSLSVHSPVWDAFKTTDKAALSTLQTERDVTIQTWKLRYRCTSALCASTSTMAVVQTNKVVRCRPTHRPASSLWRKASKWSVWREVISAEQPRLIRILTPHLNNQIWFAGSKNICIYTRLKNNETGSHSQTKNPDATPKPLKERTFGQELDEIPRTIIIITTTTAASGVA